MAKTSIYLPDDLAEQVRRYGISISEVTQPALRRAVAKAQTEENLMTDNQAVADRLRATRVVDAEMDGEKAGRARALGVQWAREDASAADLEYLATYSAPAGKFSVPLSLVFFLSLENSRRHRAAGGEGLPGASGMPQGPRDRYWADLQTGAREVWESVKPLLMEVDEHGGSLPAGSGGYSETVSPEYRQWQSREPAADALLAEHERWLAEEPAEFG